MRGRFPLRALSLRKEGEPFLVKKRKFAIEV